MKRMLWVDEPRENSRKQERPNDERDGAKTLNRSLQFALLAFAHAMSHHALRRRKGNVPKRNHRDRGHVNRACSGNPCNDHPEGAKKLPDIQSASFTKPGHDSSGESAGDGRRENAHDCERSADHTLAPVEAINRVERP